MEQSELPEVCNRLVGGLDGHDELNEDHLLGAKVIHGRQLVEDPHPLDLWEEARRREKDKQDLRPPPRDSDLRSALWLLQCHAPSPNGHLRGKFPSLSPDGRRAASCLYILIKKVTPLDFLKSH